MVLAEEVCTCGTSLLLLQMYTPIVTDYFTPDAPFFANANGLHGSPVSAIRSKEADNGETPTGQTCLSLRQQVRGCQGERVHSECTMVSPEKEGTVQGKHSNKVNMECASFNSLFSETV